MTQAYWWMCIFCCVNIYIYFMFLQTGILINLEVVSEFSKLAFCYLQCHSQKIIKLLFIWACYVWLLECRVLANTYKFHHNFGLFLKSNSHLSKKIVLFAWLKALLKRWKIFIISPLKIFSLSRYLSFCHDILVM